MAGDTLGGKVGTRVAQIAAQARMATTAQMTPLYSKIGMAMQEEFFRLTGFEVAKTVGPLWRTIADIPDAPSWLRDTATFIANGKGQWATLFAGTATGAVMGGGIGSLITNELNPPILALIAKSPNAPIAPSDAAAIAAMHVNSYEWAQLEAAFGGINGDRFAALVASRQALATATDVQQLINRGELTGGTATNALLRMGYHPDHIPWLIALRESVISPADAADMNVKGIIDEQTAVNIGGKSGVYREDMLRYMQLSGEPPGITDVMAAWRRGIIDESHVDRAIAQSRLRTEYAPVVKALQWDPLSPPDAANSVNQGHLDYAAAEHEAMLSGVKPEHFKIMVANAGRPPGPSEALDWVSRGIISEQTFRKIFLESSIKNEYVDLYLKARETVLTMGEIRLLYERGAMTREQAVTRLMKRGYSAEDAGIILVGASHGKTGKTRDLTEAQIVELYTDRAIAVTDCTTALVGMGYDATEAAQIIELADLKRFQRFFNAAISHVHSAYVAHRIPADKASSALDALNVDPAARDDYIQLWDIERQVSTKSLTPAQVVSAAKKGKIDYQGALGRLTGDGYSAEDSALLLDMAGVTPG